MHAGRWHVPKGRSYGRRLPCKITHFWPNACWIGHLGRSGVRAKQKSIAISQCSDNVVFNLKNNKM
jgi:hypothetical protein